MKSGVIKISQINIYTVKNSIIVLRKGGGGTNTVHGRCSGLWRPLVADTFSWIIPDVQLQYWFPTWCKFKAAVWTSVARGTGGKHVQLPSCAVRKTKITFRFCFKMNNWHWRFWFSFLNYIVFLNIHFFSSSSRFFHIWGRLFLFWIVLTNWVNCIFLSSDCQPCGISSDG